MRIVESLRSAWSNPLWRVVFISVSCVSLLLFLVSWASLEPTQYGLVFNSITGYVNTATPYNGGRYFLGVGKSFIVFPAHSKTLTLSSRAGSDASYVDARTGPDASDPDSGGQPIKLHCAIVYKLKLNKIGTVYKAFSTQYEQRYLQYARQTISDMAQMFEPRKFWTARTEIASRMHSAVHKAISQEGGADIVAFQLLQVDFSDSYESSIVSIQLATQARTTQEYQKQVVQVLKEIDVLDSQTTASMTVIDAKAQAAARLILNNASVAGLMLTQKSKSEAYENLRKKLKMNSSQLVEFIRLRTLISHSTQKTTVGVDDLLDDVF